MSRCWLLSIRILPSNASIFPHTTFFAYDSFPKAKAALRQWLRGFVADHKPPFDQRGGLRCLWHYSRHGYEDPTCEYEEFRNNGWLTLDRLRDLQDALVAMLSGHDVTIPLEPGNYDNGRLSLQVTDEEVCLSEDLSTTLEPILATNAFNIVKKKDYHLYVDDGCALFIDLKAVEIQ